MKDLSSQVHKILKMYLFHCNNVKCNSQSFSALSHLKTYLRVSMNQECLHHLLFLHIHKDLTDNMDLTKVMQCHGITK